MAQAHVNISSSIQIKQDKTQINTDEEKGTLKYNQEEHKKSAKKAQEEQNNARIRNHNHPCGQPHRKCPLAANRGPGTH